MSPEWTGLALAATMPAVCRLADTARLRRHPRPAGLALLLMVAVMAATQRLHDSLALGFVLPLAALSVCGLFYLPCAQLWPRVTAQLCTGTTLFAAVALVVFGPR